MAAPLLTWDQYATAWSGLHGGVDPRQARPAVRRWLRTGYSLAHLADRLHVRPGTVTAFGLLSCVLVPAFAIRGGGAALIAAALVVLAAVADTVDGALAVLGSRATRLGYVYDSVVDRLGEVCWLIALWLVGVPAAVAVTAGAMSFMHEYARSRANAAGMTEIGAVTVGERPTRVFLTALGLALAGLTRPISPNLPAGVATFAAATWVVLALIGLAQLFATVHRVLAGRSWPSWTPPGTPGSTPVPPADVAHPMDPPTGSGGDDGVPDRDPDRDFVVDEELLAELAQLTTLPSSTAVYASQAAAGRHSRSVEPVGAAEDGERAFVAREVVVAQDVDEVESPVEPPGA